MFWGIEDFCLQRNKTLSFRPQKVLPLYWKVYMSFAFYLHFLTWQLSYKSWWGSFSSIQNAICRTLDQKIYLSLMVKNTYDVTKLGMNTSQLNCSEKAFFLSLPLSLFLSLSLYWAHIQLRHEVQSHTLRFVLWKVTSGLSVMEKSFLLWSLFYLNFLEKADIRTRLCESHRLSQQ